MEGSAGHNARHATPSPREVVPAFPTDVAGVNGQEQEERQRLFARTSQVDLALTESHLAAEYTEFL